MEIFLIRAVQFILAISLLVLLHEGGHFFFSKIFGIRVDKFYIFFDAGIGKWSGSLFRFRPRNSDTTYGIGWLPLGGYCKIAGMIDESMDKEQMKQPPQPWEFRTHPAWQRLLVMVGGVLVNFLLALFIYAMVLFVWGQSYIATKDMTHGMKFNQQAKAMGFQDHDILLATDKGAFKNFDVDLYRTLSTATYCDVVRNGKKVRIPLSGEINMLDMLKATPKFVQPFIPNVIDSVLKGSPAEKAGVKHGDRVVAYKGKPVDCFNTFAEEVAMMSEDLNKGMTHDDSVKILTAPIVIERAATGKRDTMNVTLNSKVQFGALAQDMKRIYAVTTLHYGLFESIPAGIEYGINKLSGYVRDLKYIFTADGAKSLGGFGAIGSLFPASWNWQAFWSMTAFLSIILAFMNILPIPALDGGYVLFLLLEIFTGWKPSEKFMERAIYVGFFLLIGLMVIANLNDVLRWLGYM